MFKICLIVRDDKRYQSGRRLSYCTKHFDKMRRIVLEHKKRGSRIEVTYPNGELHIFGC